MVGHSESAEPRAGT